MKKSIKAFFALTVLFAGSLLSGCDSMIYDDQGDCSVYYRVPITFTNNDQGINSLKTWVNSVTLYIYDQQGNLVFKKTESGEVLKNPDYAMEVDVQPGRYNLLAWCEGDPSHTPATSFILSSNPQETLTSFSATLPLKGEEGNLYSDMDIVPLFYGYTPDVEFPDTYGTVVLPDLDITKDTNIINVAVENLEGTEITEDAITVSIEADNSEMNWNNSLIGDRPFLYKPWGITVISSIRPYETKAEDDEPSLTPVTGIFTELTTGRLMADRKPILVVHRKRDDSDIIRIDLIKYLLMVKGSYPFKWTDQEYLDCIDRYTLTFFVDADLNWYIAGGININGWKVVPPQDMEL